MRKLLSAPYSASTYSRDKNARFFLTFFTIQRIYICRRKKGTDKRESFEIILKKIYYIIGKEALELCLVIFLFVIICRIYKGFVREEK